jgi:hypothetical protein
VIPSPASPATAARETPTSGPMYRITRMATTTAAIFFRLVLSRIVSLSFPNFLQILQQNIRR